MNVDQPAAAVEAFRRFNRFYTRHVGALDEGLLETRFTLAEARVLYELGTRDGLTATTIGEELGLDPGYLSRILRGFSAARLISRKRAAHDRRQVVLALTTQGRRAFQDLNSRSQERATQVLEGLGRSGQQRLISAVTGVEQLLSKTDPAESPIVIIRDQRPGDIGWAIAAHGELYATEFGLNEEFEALVAMLFARFATHHDPSRERLWIAEVNGERMGCVFVVRNAEDPEVAQLRCLLVDPRGRGLGIGRRLVDECITFARCAGYRAMMLWTNDVLVSARRIYEAAGFTLENEEPHHSFGRDLVGQIWRRDL
jgi:DNA-binding MarR family transcriptional regulator/GNAT superfamily N-acetyltransferase